MDLESPPVPSGRTSPLVSPRSLPNHPHLQQTAAVLFLSAAASSSTTTTSGTWSQDRSPTTAGSQPLPQPPTTNRNQLFNPTCNWNSAGVALEAPKFVDCCQQGKPAGPPSTISQTRSEAVSPSSSSGTSPPPPKIRRMQVGITQPTNKSGRSVGQRIKEASLKDIISPHQHGAITPSTAAGTPRTSRTTISTCEQIVKPEPILFDEVQKNTLRVIGQYLREMGMNDTVEALIEESNVVLENAQAVRLREYINNGNWNKALDIVDRLRSKIGDDKYIALRLILLEEKLKELLACGEKLMVLRLLQIDYPKDLDDKGNDKESINRVLASRRRYYTTLLMEDTATLMSKFYPNKQRSQNNAKVMAMVQKIIPPSLMLPPARLEELLNQAWNYQVSNCKLHVKDQKMQMEDTFVLTNHECGAMEFPSKCTATLEDHCAEVWCLEFSPCGQYLASGAKSNCVIVWKIESPEIVRPFRRLQILQDVTGVSSISWSNDSKYLVVSTPEENNCGVFLFDVSTEEGTLVREYKFYGQDSFSVSSFFKDGSHKFAAGDQKGHFSFYDLDRDLPHNDSAHGNFEGYRIRALYCLRDGKSVLAADTHNRIRRYDFESHFDETIIQEMSAILFFTVDKEERQCLVTTKTEGIRLWCLKTQTLMQSFFGALHGEFVISACFGGADDTFIASGSEDDNVVIWNTKRSSPIKYLQGHRNTVNAVSWNHHPKYLSMLASGSDDGTIKIWSTNKKENR